MDGIRARITPTLDPDGYFRVQVEWTQVDNERLGDVVAVEEFRMAPQDYSGGPGRSSYVSRAVVSEGAFLPGTFWVDAAGARHFHMQAEAGFVGLTGQSLAQ